MIIWACSLPQAFLLDHLFQRDHPDLVTVPTVYVFHKGDL